MTDTITQPQAVGLPTALGKGRMRLKAIPGSVDQSTFVVEVDLYNKPGSLTVGDLRRLAQEMSDANRFEVAFRLWTVVHTAAARLKDTALDAFAVRQAEDAQHRAQFLANSEERRNDETASDAEISGPRYDYDELATDVFNGQSKKATARKWGCSPSTVQRAVTYVNERDELLDQSPEVLDQLMAGVDIATLATRYNVPSKLLKWMVSTGFDRRSLK